MKSVCRYCGTGCGLHVGVRDGKVFAVKGDRENHNRGLLCLKGFLLPQIMSAPDRCLRPLVRKGGKLVPASWDEAMGLVAARFRAAIAEHGPDSVGFYGSGQGLTEETYAANKLFKAGIRTNNVEGNPRLCMASAVGGYVSTYGKDEPMGCYEDIDHADLMLLVGSNAAEAHPILFERMARRKQTGRDVKIVVLDPRITPTSRIADLHLSFTPGTDLAILNAMAHVLVAEGLVDEEFVKAHVAFGEGKEPGKSWADYEAFLAEYTPARAAEISGARADDIVTAARWFGEKGRTAMSMWTMGLNQRTRGVWANNLVHNLHLVTGKIGVPGSTPLSLTGQPNACGGVRDGGALSHLLPYGRLVANEKHRAEMEKLWDVPAGTIRPENGLPTMDLFKALEDGKLRALYVMTTNPGQSLPNVDRWRKALEERGVPRRRRGVPPYADLGARGRGPAGGPLGGEGGRLRLHRAALPAARAGGEAGGRGASRLRDPLRARAAARARKAPALAEAGGGVGGDPDALQGDGVRLQRHEPGGAEGGARTPLAPALPRAPRHEAPLREGRGPARPRRPPAAAEVLRAPRWTRGRVAPPAPAARGGRRRGVPLHFTTGRVIEHWHTGTMTRNCRELRDANYEAIAELHPDDGAKLGVRTGATREDHLAARRGDVPREAHAGRARGSCSCTCTTPSTCATASPSTPSIPSRSSPSSRSAR